MGLLTETELKALKPHSDRDRWIGDGGGLYLRILKTGTMCWVWRHKKDGKTSYLTLGGWPAISVKAARAKVGRRAGSRLAPIVLSVRDALEEWFDDQIGPKYRNSASIRVYVNKAEAEFGARRLQELTQVEVARFVRDYGKRSPVSANRALGTLKLALRWCCEMGYLEHNPAANVSKGIAGGREKSRDRVLSDGEIRAIWKLEGPNANMLRALLLSGARIRELQRATRSHLDGDWLHVPVENSKNKKPHAVFVTPALRALFDGSGDNLFSATQRTAVQKWVRSLQTDSDDNPLQPWAALRPMNKETRAPDARAFTPHDLRRTFSTRLHETLKVPPHVVEKLLNHTPAGVGAIYNRSDLFPERIEATQKWAAELARIVKADPGRQ